MRKTKKKLNPTSHPAQDEIALTTETTSGPHISQPSSDEVELYLAKVKLCARKSDFIVAKRKKNNEFIEEFALNSNGVVNIIEQLTYKDFSKRKLNDRSSGPYKDEIVYEFGKELSLKDIDDEEHLVKLYIKFNLIENQEDNQCIAISLHRTSKIPKPAF